MCAVPSAARQTEAGHVAIHTTRIYTFASRKSLGRPFSAADKAAAQEEAREVLAILGNNPEIPRTPQELELIESVLQD